MSSSQPSQFQRPTFDSLPPMPADDLPRRIGGGGGRQSVSGGSRSGAADKTPLIIAAIGVAAAGLLGYSYYKYTSEQSRQRQRHLDNASRRQSQSRKSVAPSTKAEPKSTTSSTSTQPAAKVEAPSKPAVESSSATAEPQLAPPAATGATTTSDSTEAKPSTTTAASKADLPDDEQLRNLLGTSLERMNESGRIEGHEDLLDLLRGIDSSAAEAYSEQTRLVAAQWFVIYHTLKAIRLGGEQQDQPQQPSEGDIARISEWNQEHVADMSRAWQIVESLAPTEAEQQRQLAMFRLDIAQRGKDSKRMLSAYDNILSGESQMGPEESMATFMVAPLLGRWKDTLRLGSRVSQYQSWEEFHQLALQRPDIPDYSVLYKMASTLSDKGDSPLSGAGWETYDVTRIVATLDKYEGPDQHRPPPNVNADDRELEKGQCAYHRMGSVVRMISPSPIPIPLTGTADNTHFQLTGHAVIPQGPFKHSETYTCKLEESNDDIYLWKGTYVIEQEPEQGSSTPNMKVTFKIEMHMRRSDI